MIIGSIKLKISVYVDGSGGPNGGFGFFVKETGESFYEKKSEITNNQAEYMAIISALKKFVDTDNEITIYSDSKNTVNQLNHEFAINNEKLRDLARESWVIIAKFSNLSSFGFLEKKILQVRCLEVKIRDQKFL